MFDNTVSDEILVRQLKGGCQLSFNEIVSRYETKVFNLSLRLTRNVSDAEEVLQDVFVTVYRKIDSFQGKAKFSSWLYRITANASFMKLRKKKQDKSISMGDTMSQIENQSVCESKTFHSKSDARAINNEMRSALETAINRLPEEYRAVFVLRDIDGVSNKEVGDILGLSIPAVKSRLHRSRLMLRKKLARFYEDYKSETKIVAVGPALMRQAA